MSADGPPDGDSGRVSLDEQHRQLQAFYAALAQCYETIASGVSEGELLQSVCRSVVHAGGMKMAWIGQEDVVNRRLIPVASFGDSTRYLDGLLISTDASDPHAHGPTGVAFREQRAVWLEDFQHDPSTQPWWSRAQETGWRSSAAVPLLRNGQVFGALTMYAPDALSFTPDLRRMVGDLARGIGIGLDRLAADARMRLQGTALSAAANAIVICNRNHRIEWVNDAFTTMTGFSADEAVGVNLDELLRTKTERADGFERRRETVLGGRTWRGELLAHRKDGRAYTEEATVTPVRDESGEITHFVSIKTDVTEQRELEAQFRQSQKLESIGRLAGGIAHDFNNMLGVILGRTELAMEECDPTSPVHEDLSEILRAAQRSVDLTRRLLTFARKQPVAPRATNLSHTVADSLVLVKRLIGEDVIVDSSLAPQLWDIWIDPTQLDQIITNLCVNARDALRTQAESSAGAGAAPSAKHIFITTENRVLSAEAAATIADAVAGDYVLLRVRDTGCGMTDEVRGRIFEPFFTTKGPGEGTGLGLATVFGAVRQAGGFIHVDSAPGHGTTFDIMLPRAADELVDEVLRETPQLMGGEETILVVEDETPVLQLTALMLRRLGYHVLEARNCASGIQLLKSSADPIDLLLTDLVMPDVSGTDLATQLSRLQPGLSVMFMSGYGTDSDVASPVRADAMLAKPFTLSELARSVRECLDKRRDTPITFAAIA